MRGASTTGRKAQAVVTFMLCTFTLPLLIRNFDVLRNAKGIEDWLVAVGLMTILLIKELDDNEFFDDMHAELVETFQVVSESVVRGV